MGQGETRVIWALGGAKVGSKERAQLFFAYYCTNIMAAFKKAALSSEKHAMLPELGMR